MNTLILPVLIPLLAAPLIVLIGGRERAWFTAVLASIAGLIATLHACSLGDASTELGGWAPPVGINYALDAANRPILLLVSLAGLAGILLGRPQQLAWLNGAKLSLFYALYCLCIAGLAGITGTADAFNVFVFLEISSLSTYALVSSGPHRRALRAAFQYLVLGTLGGSFVLLGVGLLYMATGSLNMADIAARLPDSPISSAIQVGAVFLLLGFMLKSALFPLHQWLPGVYSQAPDAVATLLAASGTKVSLYALCRFAFGVLGVGWLAANHVDQILLILGAAAMLFGSLAAIRQTGLKHLLAWSSVAQIGYIVIGISLLSKDGLAAAWLFLLFHALIKGSLFVAASGLKDDSLQALIGLGSHDPWRAGCLTICALALLGVPLTVGFVGKWMLIQAAWQAGVVFAVLIIAISSLLAVVYVARIILPLWQSAETSNQNASLIGSSRLVLLAGTSACVLLGIWPGGVLEICRQAAEAFL